MIDNALEGYALANDQSATSGRRKQIEAELTELERRERAIVEAQIAGIQAGANPAIYAGMFADLSQQRQKLQTALAEIPQADQPFIAPKDAGKRFAAVLADLEYSLSAPDLNGAEKHHILATVIEKIIPEPGAYVVHFKTFGDTQKTFHTIPTVWITTLAGKR